MHLCRCALTGYSVITKLCVREEKSRRRERAQGGHIMKQTVALFTMIMMMQDDELENTLPKTSAHSTHILKYETAGMESVVTRKSLAEA